MRRKKRKVGVILRGALVFVVILIIISVAFYGLKALSGNIFNSNKNQLKLDTTKKELKSNVQKDDKNNIDNKDKTIEDASTTQNLSERFNYVKNELGSIYVMINRKNALPEDYIPSDLVVPNINFPFDYFTPKKQLVREASEALEKLSDAASAEGIKIYGISGYRSYKTQKGLYNNYVSIDGKEAADKYSAKAGTSEHQSGLTMDVSTFSENFELEQSFGETKEGKWIAQNSHKYGFIVRYQKHKESITGYSYEPWHLRYIGIEVATYLYENDLTLEEFYDLIGVKYNK